MAKILQETHVIDLSGEGNATLTIVREGQADPSVDDKVCVRARLTLPVIKVSGSLVPAILFGERVDVIVSEKLTRYWGTAEAGEGGYVGRSADRLYMAKTWAKAFAFAREGMMGEVGKIVSALKTRQACLVEAEGADEE